MIEFEKEREKLLQELEEIADHDEPVAINCYDP